ncbi:MAG: DUF3754 domain-containing protein [Chloroflexaceae bacterium]|nr:DUF3754 domain-containing protein [Chloroflexaceae bacterium]
MASYADREAFIPYRRADIIQICIEDGRLAPEQIPLFQDFCTILSAYYHVQSQKLLETLKDAFTPFNPDIDTRIRNNPTAEVQQQMEQQLVQAFEKVLKQANYTPLSSDDLQGAFASESLITLKTSVDFDDYEHVIFYFRGDNYTTATVKKWGFKKVEIEIDNLERVALLLKFKDSDHFLARKHKIEELSFTPGKMYIYLYKNVPRSDLEILFPNVKVRMNWKDRLLFIVPALVAASQLLIKIVPSLLIIAGVIALVTLGTDAAAWFSVDQRTMSNVLPVLITALTIGMTLGGFAFKQYTSYKHKRLQFLKRVTDTLFFKNLVTNAGVLYTLIDAAEEEECKEIILVYYHLLIAEQGLSREALDNAIEQWMETRLDARIDFDIGKTLRNLEALQAPIGPVQSDGNAGMTHVALLQTDTQGIHRVLPLSEANAVMDYIWDNIFQYTSPTLDELLSDSR